MMRRTLCLVLLLLFAGCVVKVRKVRVDAHAPHSYAATVRIGEDI